MDDFYVVLPSNSAKDNTPSRFLTTLQKPITLDNPEEWEIGLLEVNFKNALKTIYNDKIEVIHMYSNYPIRKDGEKLILSTPINENHFEVTPAKFFDNQRKTIKDFWHIPIPFGKDEAKVLFKSDNTATPEFEFVFHDKEIYLVNNLKFTIHINIPHFFAVVMGFVPHDDDDTLYASDDINCRTKYRFDKTSILNIPPGKTFAKYNCYCNEIDGTHYLLSFAKDQPEPPMNYDIHYVDRNCTATTIVTVSPVPGKYLKAKKLAAEFVNTEFNKYFRLNYDERQNTFKIIALNKGDDQNYYVIQFVGGIHEVLGFKKQLYSTEDIGEGKDADLSVDLERGITNIFIYCDLCQQIRVGNTTAPLLRPIAFNAHKYGDMVHTHFINPMYVPINKSFIDTIEVKICDATGEPIAFVEGLTTIILHFKRV